MTDNVTNELILKHLKSIQAKLTSVDNRLGNLETDVRAIIFSPGDLGPVEPKVCPECGHVFKGNSWSGIDAHWRSRHEDIMPYERVWPLLKSGEYKSK